MTNLRALIIAMFWCVVLPWAIMALIIMAVWLVGHYAVEIFGGLF